MATEIIENPVTGERVRWHLTAADTGGERVRGEMWVRPGGGVFAEHVHLRSEERFEVVAGRLVLERDGRQHVLLPGEHAAVPAGTPHRWRNGGEDELHLMIELDDPGDFERALAAFFALGRAGRLDARGRPRLLDAALITRRHPSDMYMTSMPIGLQRALLPLLAGVARVLRRGRFVAAFAALVALAAASAAP